MRAAVASFNPISHALSDKYINKTWWYRKDTLCSRVKLLRPIYQPTLPNALEDKAEFIRGRDSGYQEGNVCKRTCCSSSEGGTTASVNRMVIIIVRPGVTNGSFAACLRAWLFAFIIYFRSQVKARLIHILALFHHLLQKCIEKIVTKYTEHMLEIISLRDS